MINNCCVKCGEELVLFDVLQNYDYEYHRSKLFTCNNKDCLNYASITISKKDMERLDIDIKNNLRYLNY